MQHSWLLLLVCSWGRWNGYQTGSLFMFGRSSAAVMLSASSDARLPDVVRPLEAVRPSDAATTRAVAGAAAGDDDCDRIVGDCGGRVWGMPGELLQGFLRRGCGSGWRCPNPERGLRSDIIASAWLRSRISRMFVKPLACRAVT